MKPTSDVRKESSRRQELVDEGVLPGHWPAPPRQFEGIDSGSWKFEAVFARAAQLLKDAGVITGADNLYDTVYRPLSNQLGAHPTHTREEVVIDVTAA